MNAVLPPAAPRSPGPGRAQFLLLATLFFTPFVAAWLLFFYFPGARPTGTTNYGTLVTPVKELPRTWDWVQAKDTPMSSDPDRRRWTLLQIAGADCDQACADHILMTRQTRTALNAERERVQRVVLTSDAAGLDALKARFAVAHPDLIWSATGSLDEVRAFFGEHDPQTIYLIDPLGNYLMFYPGGAGITDDFKGIKKDVLKLLKLSRIG